MYHKMQNKTNACVSAAQHPSSARSGPTKRRRTPSAAHVPVRVQVSLQIQYAAKAAATKNKALMASRSTVPVKVSQHLPRPNLPPIRSAAIEALAPAYKGVPPRIVREQLLSESASLIAGLHTCDFSSIPHNSCPKELTLPVNDFVFKRAVCPTHMLAIPTTILQESGIPSTKVSLFPIHDLVFAASCSSFPSLPLSAAALEEGNRESTTTLPVVKLAIPSAWTFPIIHAYVYTKDTRALQASLLPEGWNSSVLSVMKQAKTIEGVWRNAVAFGVIDEAMVLSTTGPSLSIYDVIERSWTLVKNALIQKTTQPSSSAPSSS